MLKELTTEADIQKLVDTFYQKVLKDEVIGFIFTDVVKISLEKHMPIMYAFWSSMLLQTNAYQGNPMMKHVALNQMVQLKTEHFNQWLMLWEETVNDLFTGHKASEAIQRAKMIAVVMQRKILGEV